MILNHLYLNRTQNWLDYAMILTCSLITPLKEKQYILTIIAYKKILSLYTNKTIYSNLVKILLIKYLINLYKHYLTAFPVSNKVNFISSLFAKNIILIRCEGASAS